VSKVANYSTDNKRDLRILEKAPYSIRQLGTGYAI